MNSSNKRSTMVRSAESQTISPARQCHGNFAAVQTESQRTGPIHAFRTRFFRSRAPLLSVVAAAGLVACAGNGGTSSSFDLAAGQQSGASQSPTLSAHSRVPQPGDTNLLFGADFDGAERTTFERNLLRTGYVAFAPNAGPDGSTALRVTYPGRDNGSERVTARAPLRKKVCAAMLQFDVRFDQDWIWAKSGKLHGVGPAKPVTGGRTRIAEGWSSRTTFYDEGKIATYLYDQNPNKKWGATTPSPNRVFTRGQWHRVRLFTTLNGVNAADGSAVITVDDVEAVNVTGVVFRTADGERSLIQQFLFSTFFGGNNVSFAPKDADGNLATVTADFDNFAVYEMPSQSTCQI